MVAVTREQLRKIFKKVKHLRLPPNLEEIAFTKLYYLGWYDESDDVYYLVTEINGKLEGLRGEVQRMPRRVSMMHQCTICRQQREFEEVMLFSTHHKRLPKGVYYRVSGVYICKDFMMCNLQMKDSEEIEKFFTHIISA